MYVVVRLVWRISISFDYIVGGLIFLILILLIPSFNFLNGCLHIRVWEIYEKFAVNENNPNLRDGLRSIVDQVIADADAALGTRFDVIEMDGLDGDLMLDRRMAILIAHKELSNYEREMLTKRRALKQAAEEQEGQKTRIDALDKDYRAVLDQVELFMELCQSVGANKLSSNGLMTHMQRVHQAVEAAEAALEQVMVNAERRSAWVETDSYGRSRGGSHELDSICKARISDAASVVLVNTHTQIVMLPFCLFHFQV
jgi:hypothetical protein